MLHGNLNINSSTEYNGYILYRAIEKKNEVEVENILAKLPLPPFDKIKNKQNEPSLPPLELALTNSRIFNMLLEKYNVHIPIFDVQWALTNAADFGDADLVKSVLQKYGDRIDIEYKKWALFYAASDCRMNIVSILLEKCKDFSSEDKIKALQESLKSNEKKIEMKISVMNALIKADENNILSLLKENPINTDTSHLVKIVSGFMGLNKANLNDQENYPLYEALINNKDYATELLKGFLLLTEANLNYQNHPVLYQGLIKNKFHILSLANSFLLLANAELDYGTHQPLYHSLIEHTFSSRSLADAYIKLVDAHFDYQNHQALYEAVIQKPVYSKELNEGFVVLYKAKLEYKYYKPIYEAFINDPSLVKKITPILELMNKIGMKLTRETEHFYCKNTLITHAPLSKYILKSIINSRYNILDHSQVIYKMISFLTCENPNRTLIFRTLNNLVSYAKSNRLLEPSNSGYPSQLMTLESLISEEIFLTEGPLNKSNSTSQVEKILKKIAACELSTIRIHYNQLGQYILSLPNEPDVNLTILLNNSNLTQFSLTVSLDEQGSVIYSDDLINTFEGMLKNLIGPAWDRVSTTNPIVQLLPLTQQKVVEIYTTEFYKNINRVFRGEPIEIAGQHSFDDNAEKNNLIFFIIGFLLNDAINKLPGLVSICKEKTDWINDFQKYFTEENCILVRKEFLDSQDIQARLANAWYLPAVTSYSANKSGSIYFQKPDSTTTKLENPSLKMPIISENDESEVLFSQGQQVLSTQGPGYLIAKHVNSPLLAKPDHNWSDSALAYAITHYLSKKYKEESNVLILSGKQIVRPNHNATHVFRVMNNIELVLGYFREHAQDSEFKYFCEACSMNEIEWLRIAAVFSTTGRESEISATENLKCYDRYRAASATHFIEFLLKTKDISAPHSKLMVERIFDIVRYMGNPHYEQGKGEYPTINNIADNKERTLRNYYHRILTIAHKLDLVRCFNSDDYLTAMQLFLDLSNKNDSQQNDFLELVRYNIALVKAHGGRLSCNIEPNGKFIDVSEDYIHDIYVKSSTSIKLLYDYTQSVSYPKFAKNLPKPTI